MGSVVNEVNDINLDKYDVIDTNLIPSKQFTRVFGEDLDYIEAHLYTKDGVLINSEYDIKDYGTPSDVAPVSGGLVTAITLDPEARVKKYGFTVGDFLVQYNVMRKKITDSIDNVFFLKEISKTRTEVRLSSNILSDSEIENGVLNMLYEIESSPYYRDYLLNFGSNKIVNSINVAIDKTTSPYSVLLKLYNPLPDDIVEKQSCWIAEELSEPHVFSVNLYVEATPQRVPSLRPANFDIEIDQKYIRNSDYVNIYSLFNNSSSASYQKVLNMLSNKSATLSTDFSDYANFIHFSSAKERLLNFVYKLESIEQYRSDITKLKSIPFYSSSLTTSASIATIQSSIDGIVKNFDGYENYLYYESSSASWPKSGSYGSYYLYPTTSSQALTWLGSDDPSKSIYGGQLLSASMYDGSNQDNLAFSIPGYIVEDDQNASYLLFVHMIGQHFDNIWLYIKSVSDIYKSNNSFTSGISKDLVFSMLNSLGIKLYNSNSDKNIFEYMLGSNTSGSYDHKYFSGNYNVTASALPTSYEDVTKEYFKRIYHNLPLLLKSKGTERGIKALITTFGIPSTILDVYQYGGSDKFSDTTEYSYDRFSYALNQSGSSYVKTPWSFVRYNPTNGDNYVINPDTIEFRFKPNKFNIKQSAILFEKTVSGSGGVTPLIGVKMNYTSSNSVPSANISLVMSGSTGNVSSSLTLPIYAEQSDGDLSWWSVMLQRRYPNITNNTTGSQYYDLYVKRTQDGRILNQASCSLYVTQATHNFSWNYLGDATSMVFCNLGGSEVSGSSFMSGSNFYGDLQEFRIWTEIISQSVFDIHMKNPESIQGNYDYSAFEFLSARFPLGNNLLTYNHALTGSVYSVHPKRSSKYLSTFPYESQYGYDQLTSSSYQGISSTDALVYSGSANISNFINYANSINYSPVEQIYYTNSPNSGYYTPVTDKIRISDKTVSGSVLSNQVRQEQKDEYRTKDIHFVDISFSPNSEIDKDIIAQYGGTINIDNIIGDPKNASSDSYDQLDQIKLDYYKKFFTSFSINDYIRLISFMDNSLFKMIKDNIPARSSVQTGITIKPSLFDRSKLERKEPTVISLDPNDSVIESGEFVADSVYRSGLGDGKDFFTGELRGSYIDTVEKYKEDNYNPYALYVDGINLAAFDQSEFNTLRYNIDSYPTSSLCKKIDKFNTKISSSAAINDDFYSYKRNILPRYEGSKSTSRLYNEYTDGDTSYGKNASIDSKVDKFAFLNQANTSNLNFYDKTTCNIKYLVDGSGSVIELSRHNFHLFDIQNLFKSGDVLYVSLLDPYNPSYQIVIEGQKHIWEGGFSYHPIIYREVNEPMQFDYLRPTTFNESKLGIKGVASASLSWFTAWRYYPNAIDGSGNGGFPSLTYNGVRQSGKKYALNAGTTVNNNTWIYQSQIPVVYTQGTYINNDNSTPFNPGGTGQPEATSYWLSLDYFLPFSTASAYGGYCSVGFENKITNVDDNLTERSVHYVAPRDSSKYVMNLNIPVRITTGTNDGTGQSIFKLVGVVEKKTGSTWSYLTHTKLRLIDVPGGWAIDPDSSSIFNDVTGTTSIRVDCVVDNFQTSLIAGDELRVRMFIVEQKGLFQKVQDITIDVLSGNGSIGYFEMYDSITTVSTPVSYTTIGSTAGALYTIDTSTYDTIIFSDAASLLYNKTRFNVSGAFIPGRYDDVVYDFSFQKGDVVRFGTYYQYEANLYTVINVIEPIIYTPAASGPTVNSPLKLVLDRQVPISEFSEQKFAIFRHLPDETCVILNFNKPDGPTSAGILIPHNLKEDIKQDIGNILGPLKSKVFANVLIQ